MSRYTYKKSYSWTPSLAYIVGLWTSDGCLINDNRHLNLTSMDLENLERAMTVLSLQCQIDRKKNGFGGYGYYIQFSDVSFYDFLISAGLMPAKSKKLSEINVPDQYYRDFLRGLFDGDGCIYGFWDRRWQNSLMYYAEFASASYEFLNWLNDKNQKLIGVTRGSIKQSTRAFSLSYAKEDSKKIFNFMYYSPGLPALERKRDKFIDFIRSDPYANKELFGRVAER